MPPAVTVPPEDSQSIPEVIVTASYREQSNQDVVGSTQVFSGAELDKKGAAGLKDYLLEVPNVSLQSSGNGSRSEEHTSELQSLMRISYAVLCMKKKKNKN